MKNFIRNNTSKIDRQYYAIKVGRNNVKDLIVNSWDECSKYVVDYPAVFRVFKSRKEAEQYLENITETEIKTRINMYKIYDIKRKRKKLQKQFDFEVPDYVLDEMIENWKNKNNIIALIGLALVNNSISEAEAEILREYVVMN